MMIMMMMTMTVVVMTMMMMTINSDDYNDDDNMTQASARRAEKALQEILHKADHDSNGRVSFSPHLLDLDPKNISSLS